MNGPGGSGSAAARAGAGTAVFCRDPVRRSLVERVIPSAAIHASAMETTLAAVRMRASAVVLDIGGVEGREADLIRSLRRARPDAHLPVGPATRRTGGPRPPQGRCDRLPVDA